jgi:anaerobic selenocysteine-containing dehydrogenase
MGELPVSTATDEIEAGNLRVLLVLGGNPVTSFPETERLTAALAELDVLAVADVLHTDTTALATHVLPCAGPLERADLPYIEMLYPVVATQYTPAAVPAPFERRPAWWVLAALAERLGTSILPAGLTADTATDDDVLALQFASGPRSFAEARDAAGCVVAGPAPPGWVIDHVLPGGRWNVAPEPLVEQLRTLPDPPELALVARRQPRHMNSQLRDIAAPGGRLDRAEILVHPDQAAEHGIEDGDLIRVTSAHGSLQGRATLDPAVRPGVVSVPHGWAEPLGPNVSRLTSGTADVDPLTGMILQTGLAVTIDPAVAPVERQTVAGR